MWICTDYKIDWTAIAAGIALWIWVHDTLRRRKERAASRRLLAQIMTKPFMEAEVEIARFRESLVARFGGEASARELLDTPVEGREQIQAKALRVTLDLPSQFIDKADLFDSISASLVAKAFAQIGYLHRLWKLQVESNDDVDAQGRLRLAAAAFEQVAGTENAIKEALNAMVRVGKVS